MMIVVVLLFSLFLSSVKYHSSSVSALRLIGERFFANGTGTAYFDDGTAASFRHTITSAQDTIMITRRCLQLEKSQDLISTILSL